MVKGLIHRWKIGLVSTKDIVISWELAMGTTWIVLIKGPLILRHALIELLKYYCMNKCNQ